MIKKLMLTMMIVVITLCNSTFAYENLDVEYIGQTEELFKTKNDFFMNVPSLLPGDIYEDKAVLFNNSNSNINLYFKTEPYDKDKYELQEDYQLLEKIKLSISIKKNNELINVYDGVLGSKDFTSFKDIGSYVPKEKADFIFKIKVPTELKNNFDMTQTKVKWIFGVEKDDISKEILGNKNDDKKSNLKNKVNTSFIKTSDESQISSLLYMILLSILFFGLVRKE